MCAVESSLCVNYAHENWGAKIVKWCEFICIERFTSLSDHFQAANLSIVDSENQRKNSLHLHIPLLLLLLLPIDLNISIDLFLLLIYRSSQNLFALENQLIYLPLLHYSIIRQQLMKLYLHQFRYIYLPDK